MTAPSDPGELHALLAKHRRTLAILLGQLGQHTPAYAPPSIIHGIENAQSEIARLKQVLRAASEPAADEPNDSAPVATPAAVSAKEQKDRAAMLQRVRTTWVDGVLKRSLWNEARIALQLAERPDVVVRPYGLTLQEPGGTATALPATTRIIDVYDKQQSALLILGAPGGGKTTLLLELAETLLERATNDPQHAIPVVFNLSSWGQEQQPTRKDEKKPTMADWLVAQLNRQYDVPRAIARAWIDAGAVLPLLDGLDEVVAERRAACVDAINAYRQQHESGWSMPIVVCCRMKEYDDLPRLRQSHAVEVQPLTRAQVDMYLRDGGRALTGVRAVVRDDPTLYELLDTPLLLSVVTLAFAGQSAAALRRASTTEERRRAVFDAYVERMFAPPPQGKGDDPRYPRERMLHYVAWLARQMRQRSESIFYLERLQSTTLQSSWKETLHLVLSLATTFMGTLCAGGIAGLLVWVVVHEGFGWLSPSLRYWFGYGLIGGALSWMVVVFLGLPNSQFLGDIEPNEIIQWVPRKGLVGLVCGIIIGVFSGWYFGLIAGVLIGIIFGSIGIAFGVRGQKLDQIQHPNEGIRRTFWNAATVGSIGLFIIGTVVTTFGSAVFSEGLIAGFTLLLIVGVGIALGLWAISGGTTVVKHYTLRLLLWLGGALPWNVAAMLDAAAQRTLLRRVGGGWVFVHRMLLEYFAERAPDPAPEGVNSDDRH